jgi:hypothetical protein
MFSDYHLELFFEKFCWIRGLSDSLPTVIFEAEHLVIIMDDSPANTRQHRTIIKTGMKIATE